MKQRWVIIFVFIFVIGIAGTALAAEIPDKFQVFGIFGTRYDHTQNTGVTDFGNMLNLTITGKINNNFSVVTESEFHRNLRQDLPFAVPGGYSTGGNLHDWEWPFLQAHVKGEFDGTTVKLGRFTYIPAYGLVHGNYREVSGGLVSFGNIVKTTLVTGQSNVYWPGTSNNSSLPGADGMMQTSSYHAVDVVLPASKVTNVKVSYQKGTIPLPKEITVSGPQISFKEYGFDTKVADNLGFEAALVRSTATSDNKGSYAKLTYKGANPWKPQSQDAFIAYHKLENNSIMGNDLPLEANQKGVRYGFHYVPWMSSILTVWYDDVKTISTNTNVAKFRTQLDFFF